MTDTKDYPIPEDLQQDYSLVLESLRLHDNSNDRRVLSQLKYYIERIAAAEGRVKELEAERDENLEYQQNEFAKGNAGMDALEADNASLREQVERLKAPVSDKDADKYGSYMGKYILGDDGGAA